MMTRIRSKSHPQAALPAEGSAALISNDRLIGIYTAMLECRMLRQRAGKLAGRAKLRALASGSEAVAAAALIGLEPGDLFVSAKPHLFAAVLKGVPLRSVLRTLQVHPSAPGSADRAHVSAGVLIASSAGRVPRSITVGALAAGAAFAARHSDCENVAIAFYEGADAERSWRQAFHFALAHDLPLILIRQSARSLRPVSSRSRPGKSAPGNLPIIPVDADDAVALYRVAHEAITHARRGSGPTLIDCVPLRLAGERKQDSDCIARMERYLQAKGLRPERTKAGVTAKFTRAVDAAITAARRDVRKKGNARRSGKRS
jgi:TPP-dependent pyruvate/acetoin dehydrogenase alpha subunit